MYWTRHGTSLCSVNGVSVTLANVSCPGEPCGADCSHSLLNRLQVQGELGSETNSWISVEILQKEAICAPPLRSVDRLVKDNERDGLGLPWFPWTHLCSF